MHDDKWTWRHGFPVVYKVQEVSMKYRFLIEGKAANHFNMDGAGPLSNFHFSPGGVVSKVMSVTEGLLKRWLLQVTSSTEAFLSNILALWHPALLQQELRNFLFFKVAEYCSGWTGRGLDDASPLHSNAVKRKIYTNVI